MSESIRLAASFLSTKQSESSDSDDFEEVDHQDISVGWKTKSKSLRPNSYDVVWNNKKESSKSKFRKKDDKKHASEKANPSQFLKDVKTGEILPRDNHSLRLTQHTEADWRRYQEEFVVKKSLPKFYDFSLYPAPFEYVEDLSLCPVRMVNSRSKHIDTDPFSQSVCGVAKYELHANYASKEEFESSKKPVRLRIYESGNLYIEAEAGEEGGAHLLQGQGLEKFAAKTSSAKSYTIPFENIRDIFVDNPKDAIFGFSAAIPPGVNFSKVTGHDKSDHPELLLKEFHRFVFSVPAYKDDSARVDFIQESILKMRRANHIKNLMINFRREQFREFEVEKLEKISEGEAGGRFGAGCVVS